MRQRALPRDDRRKDTDRTGTPVATASLPEASAPRAPRALPACSYAALALLVWTATLAGSLTWNLHRQRSAIRDLVTHTARAYFEKDLVYRRWGASHGLAANFDAHFQVIQVASACIAIAQGVAKIIEERNPLRRISGQKREGLPPHLNRLMQII